MRKLAMIVVAGLIAATPALAQQIAMPDTQGYGDFSPPKQRPAVKKPAKAAASTGGDRKGYFTDYKAGTLPPASSSSSLAFKRTQTKGMSGLTIQDPDASCPPGTRRNQRTGACTP